MSEPMHTPGPWEVSGGYVVASDTKALKPTMPIPDGIRISIALYEIARVSAPERWSLGDAHVHQEANARLIAATPALLVALKELVADSDDVDDGKLPAISAATLSRARAAIAKATGDAK